MKRSYEHFNRCIIFIYWWFWFCNRILLHKIIMIISIEYDRIITCIKFNVSLWKTFLSAIVFWVNLHRAHVVHTKYDVFLIRDAIKCTTPRKECLVPQPFNMYEVIVCGTSISNDYVTMAFLLRCSSLRTNESNSEYVVLIWFHSYCNSSVNIIFAQEASNELIGGF